MSEYIPHEARLKAELEEVRLKSKLEEARQVIAALRDENEKLRADIYARNADYRRVRACLDGVVITDNPEHEVPKE